MKYFNSVAALLLIAVYALGSIPPSERFNLWLVSFAIPFALLVNILLVVVGVVLRKKTTIFLLAALVFGGKYLFSTIGIKSLFKRAHSSEKGSFSVLNYNVSAFNVIGDDSSGQASRQRDSLRLRMIDWVLNGPGDIQCLQEFPHHPEPNGFDFLREISDRGKHYFFSGSTNKWDSVKFGILTISRYPIVRSGDVMVSWNGYNRISYADVAIEKDTIRIVNVHLQSMQMKGFHPAYSETIERGTRNMRVVMQKLKSGVFERSRQIKALISFIKTSPYPVICAGDFNELPYSYSYQRLRKHVINSFEESGRGFGFTYNGNTMNMLRIDNQFYSSQLRSLEFHTLDTVRYTDHFPLMGRYGVKARVR